MAWFKVDDSFHSHSKVYAASPAALGLWVVAGSWSSANRKDGFVPDHALGRLLPDAAELAKELTTAGLWRRVRGGYQFHDWHDFNPTAEEIEADRKAARERMRQIRAKRREKYTSAGQGSNGSGEHSGTFGERAEDVRDPDPSRPEPSKEGSDAARLKFDNAVRIPEPFPLSEDMKQWVRDNTPGIDAWKEHEKFIDHWLGAPDKTGRKKDWLATWRNWMRRAQEYAEEAIARRGENKPRTLAAADERCGLHPRQLADHCTICDAEARGAA